MTQWTAGSLLVMHSVVTSICCVDNEGCQRSVGRTAQMDIIETPSDLSRPPMCDMFTHSTLCWMEMNCTAKLRILEAQQHTFRHKALDVRRKSIIFRYLSALSLLRVFEWLGNEICLLNAFSMKCIIAHPELCGV